METVEVTVRVPKEGKEIVDAAVAIIAHFRAGKSLAEAAALLPSVMQAVDGWDKLGAEISSAQNDELAGYTVQKIIAALKPAVPAI